MALIGHLEQTRPLPTTFSGNVRWFAGIQIILFGFGMLFLMAHGWRAVVVSARNAPSGRAGETALVLDQS
jgi:hypothetical protein